MHHLALSSQLISLSFWAAVSHFWCFLVFSWGWLQALRYGGGVREEEEGTPRSKSRCKYVSTSTIAVTGTYRMVSKVALILLPYVPTWTKTEWCWYQMIENWASKVHWGRELQRPSCFSLAVTHISPPASFKLLATSLPMPLSRQLALFAMAVHCCHIFNLASIITPKFFWERLLLSQLLPR